MGAICRTSRMTRPCDRPGSGRLLMWYREQMGPDRIIGPVSGCTTDRGRASAPGAHDVIIIVL